ncbi:ATP-binding cassette domain-containing protein, partial [uncultured Bilophila sp.]
MEVDGLTVRFDTSERSVVAVKNLNFHVRAGEVLAIVGESGSGKSVTSLSIMRLIEHGGGTIAEGSIAFTRRNGQTLDLARANDATMRTIRGGEISMIFQEPMTSLNPVFPVGVQVAEAVMLHQGLSRAEAQAEALRMLELVRIPEAKQVLKRYPHQLSGGMRQRVMIAMALSCKPSLLIADEPTTALDVTIQAQILQLIRQLQEEMHMAVIFITHDMGVVAEVADRVLVMYHGEAVEEGDCTQIFHEPRHPYTRSLLAAVPRLGSMRGTDDPAPFPLLHPKDPEAERMGLAVDAKASAPSTEAAAPVRPGTEPVLRVNKLVTRFDVETSFWGTVKRRVHAVEQVSFDLYPGETLGLVGESGCGKSTIGRSLIGLETPRSGDIFFDGHDLMRLSSAHLQKLRRNIQYVFQDPYASLDPRLTVGFSIMEPLLIHKVCSRQEAERKVAQLL